MPSQPSILFPTADRFRLLAVFILSIVVASAAEPHDSSRWEKAIRAFEQTDLTTPPPKESVLFVGSSSIVRWKSLKTDFPGVTVINRGFGGSQIADSIAFMPRIITKYHPSKVILYAGDNDLAKGKSAEVVANDFKRFATQLWSELEHTEIGFIAIKPSPKRWHLNEEIMTANRLIRTFCENHRKLTYLDIYTPMLDVEGKPKANLFVEDKLHLSALGYSIWTTVLQPFVSATQR